MIIGLYSSPNIIQIEKNEMGWTCSAYGGRCILGFGGKNIRERDNLEDPGVDGRIMSWIVRKCVGETWTGDLAQDRDMWRALVNAALNFRVP